MDPVAPKHLGADLISPDSPDLLPLSRLLTLPTGSLFLLRCGELPLQGSALSALAAISAATLSCQRGWHVDPGAPQCVGTQGPNQGSNLRPLHCRADS